MGRSNWARPSTKGGDLMIDMVSTNIGAMVSEFPAAEAIISKAWSRDK